MDATSNRNVELCASCEEVINGRPVHKSGHTYCCGGCADGGPCLCSYEPDLAADGVDHMGLLCAPRADDFESETMTAWASAAATTPAGRELPRSIEVDLADDGVDHLGLIGVPSATPTAAATGEEKRLIVAR
jgi:hypothetical protein